MKTDHITFKSKINFVSEKAFDKLRQGAYVDVRKIKILPNGQECRVGMNNADEFYTDEVRTCTAGALINTKTGEALGFHYYDNLNNLENIGIFLKNLFSQISNPDRGLLIGSKYLKGSNYSLPIFKCFNEEFSKRIKNLSVFREHLFKDSESNFHYSKKEDTYTIHSTFRENMGTNYRDVTSSDLLNQSYKEIKLANGDELYINGTNVII